ncbi:MAG: hypothetical protein Q7K29_06860 [Thermoleophilia bacterium]|nr:hypothetical protein [Thermoleophilia bacterium]
MNDSDKHFLDTSVARSFLLGSNNYRKYFKEQFGSDRLYVSAYVLMEFKRSYLCQIINFYFLLDMPSVHTISDAIQAWSNRFKTSELKAVLQLVSQLFAMRTLDLNNIKHKEIALRAIGQYVKRLEIKTRRGFINIGKNEIQCARAKVTLKFQNQMDFTEDFRAFLYDINEIEVCRENCSVNDFILIRHKAPVESFIKHSEVLCSPKSNENNGFVNITEKLDSVLRGKAAFSCKLCEAIGDAVIALEAPRDMRLEHTDYSFDHLCPVVGQPHYRHPSERAVIKESK